MNSKEYREFLETYNGIYEEVGVKMKPGESAGEALSRISGGKIPADKVIDPSKKTTLDKAHYEVEGEEYLDEAPIASRNYGDPVAANWNRGYGVYMRAQRQGREMITPSIPRGYAFNPPAGTITRGGAAPTPPTAKSRPAAPVKQNLRGLSVGPGGFNINNRPVQTTRPAAAPAPTARPAAPAPTARPAAAPAPTARPAAAPAPTARPPATASYSGATGVKPLGTTSVSGGVKPVPSAPAQDAPVFSPPKPANKLMQGMPSVSSTAAPAGGPTLSARAQALKAGGPQGGARARVLNQDLDLFDVIKGHLLDEGYADTEESALVIMANMSEEWRQSIVEALRDLFDPNKSVAAQAQKQSPFANQPTKSLPSDPSPFAKPPSRTDSGKLTTYGAGGGAAAERGGKTRAQVMQQGAKNLERKPTAKNQGPDFGR